ncbi:hypothetical protein HOLleu_03733 [Holothuria leucospilota]|uniref:Uncharacterized protein n=1 Tax=Holothuria leucospilota TaxID=206669 RepID=A0A9Q1HKE3_HOLLE|nr:hypothetical protein HOLleu_03733 [Holothuria leucospilota]
MEQDILKSNEQPKSTKGRAFGSTRERKGERPEQDSSSSSTFKKESSASIKRKKPKYVQSDPPRVINQNYQENEEQPPSATHVLDEPVVVDDVYHTTDRDLDKYDTLLGEGTWLNDDVVNDYISYLQTQVSNFEIFVCNSFHTVSNVPESEQVRR